MTEGAERLPVEPLGLEDVAVDLVHLAPPRHPVCRCFYPRRGPWALGQPGEHVDGELRILFDLIQADGLIQLHLALDDGEVPLLIHPSSPSTGR